MTTAVLVNYIDQDREQFGVEPICTVLRHASMQIALSSPIAVLDLWLEKPAPLEVVEYRF